MSAWFVVLLVGMAVSGASAEEIIFPRASMLGGILFCVFGAMLFLSLLRAVFRSEG